MKFITSVVICWVLVGSAQAEQLPVKLRTIPSRVRVNNQYWSDETVFLNFEGPTHTAQLVLDGQDYEVLKLDVSRGSVEAAGGIYPAAESPPLRLTPRHFWVPWKSWAQRSPALAATLLLAALALLWTGINRLRQSQRRQVRLGEFRSQSDPNDSALLKTLGGYLLVERLGAGGMATVYRGVPAESLDEKESVAIKILSRETMDDAAAISRFRREVQAYQRLNHNHIVRIYDWKEPTDESSPYLVLEYVRGQTLRDALKKGPIPINQAMGWLEQLFAAIAYAHAQGTVHRDLKPENIMIDGNRLKVMDFGLARSVDASYLTQTGTVLGTPAYMAPEQLSEGSTAPSIDQYALGLISYEVLSGRRPIEEPDIARLLMRLLTEVPVAPSQHRPHLSKTVDAALLRMLEKQPDQRFPDVTSAWKGLRG